MARSANLRTCRVVRESLLPSFRVALLLVLLDLRRITEVMLVTSERQCRVGLLRSFSGAAFATRHRRLRSTLLNAIVTVLNSALSLNGPSVLILLLSNRVRMVKGAFT